MKLYFMPPLAAQSPLPVRLDAFGFANHLGIVGAVLLLLLMLISSDRALRRLGAIRWKRVQRLNYLAAAAVVMHGVLYQLLEHRAVPMVIGFALTIAAAFLLQAAGRRSHRSKAAGP